jgi:hypothetical protein
VTDKYGELELALPPGVYTAKASAAGIVVVGDAVNLDTKTVESEPALVSVPGGQDTTLTLEVSRFHSDDVNLHALHDAKKPVYKSANCKTCHTDMQGFKTTDTATPPKAPYHAGKTHAGLDCLFCHKATEVNPGNWTSRSGATLRKQVNVDICAGCHANYPKQFP